MLATRCRQKDRSGHTLFFIQGGAEIPGLDEPDAYQCHMGPLGQSVDKHLQKGMAGSLLGHFKEDFFEGFKFRFVLRVHGHVPRINEKLLLYNET